MSKAKERNDKGPDKEESIPTASMGGSAVGPGGQIGPYKLLSILGEGGFAVVYLAEQQKPVKRRVALKVIKPGMDTKQVIARFEAERQALALLEHPNIAQVYDAGTTEAGRPYFVMEYVRGISLTEHCDGEKLSIEERLELFLRVCEAVQHAHQKGIIHRDIKPSNVLVSIEGEKGLPKIIDFGVAKAITQPLTERTLFTEQGQLIGTPEYMSPEQAGMTAQDIDTRSDIYSLGVLLYELLTGALPFDRKILEEAGFAEIQRIIREEDPPLPSTKLSDLGEDATKIAKSRRTEVAALAKRLHKELEWIPLKAMRKERTHRYRSASEFADDIQNYLTGAPLIAGPESVVYRLKKFVRRKRTLLMSAAAVVAALVGMVVLYTVAEKMEIERFKVEATKLLQKGLYEEAEETFARILALDERDPDAHKGISKAREQQKLRRDMELADKYLNESHFDIALGLALSAQQRFPDDPRVLKMVRWAKGTGTLSMKFDLGTITKATLKKITEETDEPAVTLPVGELLSPCSIDIDPGWYWLTISYEPNEITDPLKREVKKYLLFVRRETSYNIHARRALVGDVPEADFKSLEEALRFCEPGNILCLGPGEHRLRPGSAFGIPNISIESKDSRELANVDLDDFRISDTWDIKLSNLRFRGVGKAMPIDKGFAGQIFFENSVLCKVIGCTLRSTSIDTQDCDGVELASNRFLMYAHHRSSNSGSRRFILRNNTVYRTWEVIGVEKGSPAEQAGLQVNDKVISLDGNPLLPDVDLPEVIRERKERKPLALVVERWIGDDLSEITIQLEPKWSQQDQAFKVGLEFASIVGFRTFSFKSCQTVIAYGNEINRSGLTGVHLDLCSDALVACNSLRENHEGNIYLLHTDRAVLAFNDLHSISHYNIFLSHSSGDIIHQNQIRGGKAGIRIQGAGNVFRSNLITDSDPAVLFSGGHQNMIENNIFAQNKLSLQGEGTYWGTAIVRANLMDKRIDSNSLGNVRLDMKDDNIICQFELSESVGNLGRFLAKTKDVNDAPDLQSHTYGPVLALKSQYLAVCESIADRALEFGRLKEDIPIDKEFGDDLAHKTSEMANNVCSLGPPKINEKSLGIYLEMLAATQELKENQGDIPRHAKSFANHHYTLYVLAMNWKDAKKFCESVGGHLASITSQEEDEWIRETFPPSLEFWLGGTDEDEEGKWEWVTEEKWQYCSWGEGQPDNYEGVENALHMWENGYWNDLNTEMERCFLIEWDR